MKLPVVGPQVDIHAEATGPTASPAAFAAPWTTLAAGSHEILNRAEYVLGQHAQREAVADASKRIAQARVDMTNGLLEAQRTAPEGAPNFTPGFLQKFDDYAQQTLDNAPDLTKPYLERHLANLRATLGDHALTFESQQNIAKRQKDLGETLNLQANVVRTDDTQFEHALGEAVGAVHSSGLPADQMRQAE